MSIVREARLFATAAHHAIDQRRKYTNEPYIGHPQRVVELVEGVIHTPEMLAAAWLHDVVEDTKVSMDVIYEAFGADIGNMVYALTNESLAVGNRAKRHKMNTERLAKASWQVKAIKCADLIDNTSTIVQFDPKFAPTYLREKLETLEAIYDSHAYLGHIWQRAWDQCQEALTKC